MKVIKGGLSPREIAMISTAILSLTGAYLKAVFVPKNRQITEMSEQIAKQAKELAWKSKVLESSAPRADIRDESPQRSVAQYLAQNSTFGELVRSLSGNNAQFTLNRLALEKQESKTGYTKNTFTVEIETSFLKLGQFVEALEHSDFLLEITSVEVIRISHELRRCTAKVQLDSYVARQ